VFKLILPQFPCRRSWIVALCIVIHLMCIGVSSTQAQSGPLAPATRIASVQLSLRSDAECPSNLLILSDLVELKGSDALIQEISELPIAPAPKLGSKQAWSRDSIEKVLLLRGIASESMRWAGASECNVRRIEGQRVAKSDSELNSRKLNSPTSSVQPSSFIEMKPNTSLASNVNKPVDKAQFTPAFTTPITVTQAERLAAEAISNYLRSKTNSDGRWIVAAKIPSEHAKTLSMQRQILGVAGGQPPWEGDQEFMFHVKTSTGEQIIPIRAVVKLPEMVIAANRPLAKGYVLKGEDLVWIPMPRGLPYGPEDCFSQVDSLVGQQLRRSMSTQQVVRLNEVGPPTIIHVGDIIAIDVVSGGISVGTNGRAIEAGGMDDLIQVDVEPNRTRVLARITGPKAAEVIANGNRNPSGNLKQAKSNPKTFRR
jgi:flagella basal body P-ring formation protein FlgA